MLILRTIFFVVVLIGGALSQELSPSESVSTQQAQTKTEPSKRTTSTDQRGTEQSPFIVKVVPPEKTEEERTAEAQERKDKAALDRRLVDLTAELASYTGGLFYATVILAIATTFLFSATVGLMILEWRKEKNVPNSRASLHFWGRPNSSP